MKQAFSRQRSVAYYDPPPSPVPSPDLSYVDVCQHTRSRTIDFGVLDYCSSTAPPSYTTFIESQKSADLENQKFQNQQKGLTRSTSFTAGSTQQATQQRSPTKIQPTSPLRGATVVTSPTTVPSAAQNFASLGPRPIQRVASTPNLVNSPKLSINSGNSANSVKSSSFSSGGLISGIQSTPKISNIRTAPPPNPTPNPTANPTPNSAPNLTSNPIQQPQLIHSPQTTTPGTTQVPIAPQFGNPKSVPATVPSKPQSPPQPSVEPVQAPAVQSEDERGRPTSRKAENVQRLSSIKLRRTQSNRRIESRDNSGWFSFISKLPIGHGNGPMRVHDRFMKTYNSNGTRNEASFTK